MPSPLPPSLGGGGGEGNGGEEEAVVMGEGGGGSNVMAMKDAHRCFASCFCGGAEYRLETSVPRVGILKPKQEGRGTGGWGLCQKQS